MFIPGTMVCIFVKKMYVIDRISSYAYRSPKRYGGRQGKVVRSQSSRFGRHPCSVERVACAETVFSAGVGKTISRVFSVRRYCVPGTLIYLECWCVLLIHLSLKTTRPAYTWHIYTYNQARRQTYVTKKKRKLDAAL